jgi:putative ABC transport system permease protein
MLILIEDIIVSGIILGFCAIGFTLSLKIIDFPDLSVDGTYALGGAACAMALVKGAPPIFSVFIGAIAGALSGMVLSILHSYTRIGKLLAGILMLSILYSATLLLMGGANRSLLNSPSLFDLARSYVGGLTTHLVPVGTTVSLIIALAAAIFLLVWFLFSSSGLAIRGVGSNALAFQSCGRDHRPVQVLGMTVAGVFPGISGALAAQQRGGADINMGIGMLVIMLAAYLLGVSGMQTTARFLGSASTGKGTFFEFDQFQSSPLSMGLLFAAALIGAIIYQVILTVALKFGFWSGGIKMVTALIVLGLLVLRRDFRPLGNGLL